MRTRVVELGMAAVALIVGSCRFPSSTNPSCDDDIELCPTSSRAATSVTCSCECTIGSGLDSVNRFAGVVAMCLPPDLNARSATSEQQVALQAMEARAFDQRVYNFCSGNVASFVRLAIKAHADLKLTACVLPVMCDCHTEGATRDSDACHKPCTDVP